MQKEELDNWFGERNKEAEKGLRDLGFSRFMEVKMYLEESISKTNPELKEAARKSIIHTFGWPIGVFLDSKVEYGPQPQSYGIKAEISIKDSEEPIDKRYDYWAIKKDGAFYLLKSLFEDSRKPGYLFFSTRIIRITEVLMYASKLYSNLGVDDNKKIIIQIKHSGLSGSIMTAVGNRMLFGEYKNYSTDGKSTKEIQATLKDLDEKTADKVKEIVDPLFEQFNWLEIGKSVIDDIVLNYKQGRVT